MPRRDDIKKVMVIGSGPIVIGQAAEFDYAGTQACLALKEAGYKVLLVNSNPATIMTDKIMADKTYMEPLTLEYVSKIIRKERPDAIIPSLGGQTGLNLVVELAERGVLSECQVEILGTGLESIQKAEDRNLFKQLCIEIGEPVIESGIANNVEEVLQLAKEIGYPIVLRPAFTLGGTGGGFVYHEEECKVLAQKALELSPRTQVLVEKSLLGYKEIEFEVIRDHLDETIIVCDMENIDPVGIHTGDSIVNAPTLTVEKEILTKLSDSAKKIIKALKIAGGCNIQYALHPTSGEYYLIEVNPRVSRSSALASKATSYPIAKVTTLIAMGYNLKEIEILDQNASMAPRVKYNVLKVSRFPFDKFTSANRMLSTQMKATGEIMALGKTFEESLLKALRSLEYTYDYLNYVPKEGESVESLLKRIEKGDDERIYVLGTLLRNGVSVDQIAKATQITPFFIEKIAKIVYFEKEIEFNEEKIRQAKELGMSDKVLAEILNKTEDEIRNFRLSHHITPEFDYVDACSSGVYLPYLYSTYHGHGRNQITAKEKVLVVGAGPIRIGQGVEFDYSTVHCIQTIKKLGYEAIVINNNPETVSTDYTVSDKLYFEPITLEDVLNIIDVEKPLGVIVQLGGQTAINMAKGLSDHGINILGTSKDSIDLAENREFFERLLQENNIKQPQGKAIVDKSQGTLVANQIGYPVLVRPSFVLGGQSMQIVYNDQELVEYLDHIGIITSDKPILIDRYIKGKEVELDAISDGVDVLIPGLMEHIEKTGVHSGDSISVFPPFSLSTKVVRKIELITKKVGIALKIKGLFNIQFIVDGNDEVYIIEVNPRASRSVPFISKATTINLCELATRIIMGETIQSFHQGVGLIHKESSRYYVKTPTFSFSKIAGLDSKLGPEMKSTGEAIGIADSMNRALYKSLQASGMDIKEWGTVLLTIADEDKEDALDLAQRFYDLGFNIVATHNTAKFLKECGMKVKSLKKISEGSDEILTWIKNGYIKYIINTQSGLANAKNDGFIIRSQASISNVTTLTSLDTASVLLTILEERSLRIDAI